MISISSYFNNRYQILFQEIKKQICIQEIPNTKDIWVRDFMPIRNSKGKWILFKYFPKYLQNPKFHHLISDNQTICKDLGIEYEYVDIIMDGGSVVYKNDLYFVSERVFTDNPKLSKEKITEILKEKLATENLHFLPAMEKDFTGHLDGVLYIIDDNRILINDGQDEYTENLKVRLKDLGFTIEFLPYNPCQNKTYQSARGIYINFIETDSKILLPIFKLPEDEMAMKKLEKVFPNKEICPIDCNDLAKEGGLLHCISWD
ncbi:agmatine deiminase family protein [Sphingobacterium sp. CZ-2]|uniref:agmatine deiminase family protein n=1 Tax=Sphingobacterium sp. CZ-2 TaxID=2557994 RepID=UPI001431F09F|nr:agmatine deiminase family protein [Sphingobacterium sp. CZ-2]